MAAALWLLNKKKQHFFSLIFFAHKGITSRNEYFFNVSKFWSVPVCTNGFKKFVSLAVYEMYCLVLFTYFKILPRELSSEALKRFYLFKPKNPPTTPKTPSKRFWSTCTYGGSFFHAMRWQY
jgi:hypothetical protein